MILKFEEFINEGILSKTLNRTKSDKKRLGDITDFDKYLETVEWVDLGHPDYLFAKEDFLQGMTIQDAMKLKLPKGISILSEKLVEWLNVNCEYKKEKLKIPRKNSSWCISLSSNNNFIYLNLDFNLTYIADKFILSNDNNTIQICIILSSNLKTVSKDEYLKFDTVDEYIFKLSKEK